MILQPGGAFARSLVRVMTWNCVLKVKPAKESQYSAILDTWASVAGLLLAEAYIVVKPVSTVVYTLA